DYHWPGFMGSFSSSIGLTFLIVKVTNLLHGVLWYLHTYVMPWSWGVCILLLTVLVRGLMFPFSRKQALNMIKMQAMAPELKKLQEKYKNDRQALGLAQMELYRTHGVNPVGTCWIILAQMPIFMGLYYALQESIHFRLAPFLWIRNLAAPDMLFWWGQQVPGITSPDALHIPLLGAIGGLGGVMYLGPYFNLLPIIAVALMLVSTKMMTPPPTDEHP